MIMTVMKVLELITGHNTSFSVLIRKLIGNKLLCISLLSWCGIKTHPNCGIFYIMCGSLSLPER